MNIPRKPCLTALVALAAWSASVAAAPAMWKVTDEDSTVWLFGSVHVLPADTQWRSPLLKDVLESAELFYYELSLDKASQMKIAALMGRYGLNLGGKKLTDYLSEEEAELLKEVTNDLGLPLARLQVMKPWMASITLELMFLRNSGYQAGQGVEKTLMPRTPDEQERYFETAEEQIGFLKGLSTEAAVDALVATLHHVQEQPKFFDRLVAAWAAGDVETLSSLFHEAMKESGPAFYQALIVDRNKAWVAELLDRMEGDKDILVIVGAGHLVGEDGLPAMLDAKGMTVERVQ